LFSQCDVIRRSDRPVSFAGSKRSGLGWCWPAKAGAGEGAGCASAGLAASEAARRARAGHDERIPARQVAHGIVSFTT
jgi:hypothetical protein